MENVITEIATSMEVPVAYIYMETYTVGPCPVKIPCNVDVE